MKPKPSFSQWTDEQWDAIAIRNTNVLVSAGAGSGKTAVLSERVLELVREGVDITNLIVLTFTNAAAAEMKQRIRNKLIDAGNENQFILENANKIDSSFITTFDSYCLYLVKKYSYLLNVGQNISIIDNVTASQQKQQIINTVLIELVEAGDQDVIDFIDVYSATSITEITTMLLAFYNSKIQNMNGFEVVDIEQSFNLYEQFISAKLDMVKQLVADINLYAADTNMPEKINERLVNLLAAQDYQQIHANIEEVFETKFWQIPRTDFEDKEYVKKVNDNLKKELKDIRKYCSKSKDEHLQLVTNSQHYKLIINRILECFTKKFNQFKQQSGLFEFIDINLMAIELLQNNTDVCQQLSSSVYEIMIDEYQDTNDIQETFVNLIANNNVYMVGDIKQSIYGFRNANPGLFAAKFASYQQQQGGQLITLTKNFRSRSSILEQVNNLFEQVMSAEYGGIKYDQSQIMQYGNTSFDLLADINKNELITYDSSQLEIDKSDYEIIQIFKDIKHKLETGYQVVDRGQTRNVNLSDFAIIAATREKFERITQIGEYYNLSVNADIQEQFSSSNEIAVVQSIFNILNIIKNNNDDDQKFIYSVIQLARSYLFDYSDQEIDSAVDNLNRIKSYEINKRVYSLQVNQLSELGQLINDISTNIDLKSNSFIFNQALSSFAIAEKLYRLTNPLVRQLRLTKISELIEDFDKRNYSLNQVCQILNEVEQNSELDIEFNSKSDLEADSVTIITTHKSKGLEYNICYFPFLFKKFNVMDLNSRVAYDFNFQYVLPSKIGNGNLTTTFEKYIFNNSSKQQLISEKIRLFYVALTRAKDSNILLVDCQKLESEKFNSINNATTLNDIIFNGWNALKNDVKPSYSLNEDEVNASKYNLFKAKTKQVQVKKTDIDYKQLQIDTEVFEKRRASGHISELITKEVASNIKLGNDIHEYLEYCDLFNIEQQIVISEGYLKQALISIYNSNLLNGMINYYPEFQFKIIDEYDLNGIIDLLVETEDKFIIIDYKLNAIEKEEYVNQVNTYVEYIKSISDKQVEGYLLSLLSGAVKRIH